MSHSVHYPFSDLLPQFRKRAKLSQKALAEKIGVHRNTIIAWEQGDYLPKNRPIISILAQALQLAEEETIILLQACFFPLFPPQHDGGAAPGQSPSEGKRAPVSLWYVPHQRNRFFTARQELLNTLHHRLCGDQTVALTQTYALHGLGGIGKTQVAIEYAYRFASAYRAIFWIDAETVETIVASFFHIAQHLEILSQQEPSQQQIVAMVGRWLAQHPGWLLIWDNVEDSSLLTYYLPGTREGTILLTTRLQSLGNLALSLEVSPLPPDESVLLLLRRAKILDLTAPADLVESFKRTSPKEYTLARELVALAAGLPLALDQMAAYMEETPCSLSDYVHLYRSREAELLRRRGRSTPTYPASVTTTWSLSFEKISQESLAARDLLCICAFLAPDAIPEELFVKGAAFSGESLCQVATNSLRMLEVISIPHAYSLLKRDIEEHTLSMHRLVQAVLREEMKEAERTCWHHQVLCMLTAAFPELPPESTFETWRQCERLLAHVMVCVTALPLQAASLELAALLEKAAQYLYGCARYEQAEPFYERVLRIRQQLLEPEDPQVASALRQLANLYREQGKYEQAEPMLKRALHILEAALGPVDLEVKHALYVLGWLSYEQGNYEQARALFERALQICRHLLDPEHPEVGFILEALANLHYEQKHYSQATLFYQQTLHILEPVLGSEHPQIAYPLEGLASSYTEQEKYGQAEPLFEQALRIWEQAEPEHPQVASLLTGQATLYRRMKRYEQAEALFERALQIWEQAVGPMHPQVASSLTGLAILYHEQKRCEEAESCYQRALTIREQYQDSSHPQTASILLGLARLYVEQSKEPQAEALLRRACTILEHCLGQDHPETMQVKDELMKLM